MDTPKFTDLLKDKSSNIDEIKWYENEPPKLPLTCSALLVCSKCGFQDGFDIVLDENIDKSFEDDLKKAGWTTKRKWLFGPERKVCPKCSGVKK